MTPPWPTWKPYQARIAHDQELVRWFAQPNVGIALIAGAVSGNIELLDFDDPSTLRPWGDLVEDAAPGLMARLVIVQTPTEGRQWSRHHLQWEGEFEYFDHMGRPQKQVASKRIAKKGGRPRKQNSSVPRVTNS